MTAGAGRSGSLWHGKLIDGHEGSDFLSIADLESPDLPVDTISAPISFQAAAPWSMSSLTVAPPSVGHEQSTVDHVDAIGPAPAPVIEPAAAATITTSLSAPVDSGSMMTYRALGTPDAGGS